MPIAHMSFGRNVRGRDFVIGDLHGCHQLLMDRLAEVAFAPDRDRLFAVGDLVDRGPDSPACVALLDEPWFHSARGNHEQMLCAAAAGVGDLVLWRLNGGDWAMTGADGTGLRADLGRMAALIERRMPLALTIDTAIGPVGICHAVSPDDWAAVETITEPRAVERLIWGRALPSRPVANVARVFVGHTVRPAVAVTHNIVSIDTGAVLTGHLTLMALDAALPDHP